MVIPCLLNACKTSEVMIVIRPEFSAYVIASPTTFVKNMFNICLTSS